MKPGPRRWLRFALAMLGLVGLVAGLHLVGSNLPGGPGALIAQNKAQDREVYAYFYSDLGEMQAFLDDARGAYGAQALRRALQDSPPTP